MAKLPIPVTIVPGNENIDMAYATDIKRREGSSDTVDVDLTNVENRVTQNETDISNKLQADTDATITATFSFEENKLILDGDNVVNTTDLHDALSNLPQESLPNELRVLTGHVTITHTAGDIQYRHGVNRAVQLNVTNANNADGTLFGDITNPAITYPSTLSSHNLLGWGSEKEFVAFLFTFSRVPARNNPVFEYTNTVGQVRDLVGVNGSNQIVIPNPGNNSDTRVVSSEVTGTYAPYVPQANDKFLMVSVPRGGESMEFVTAVYRGGTWYAGEVIGAPSLSLPTFTGYSDFSWNSIHPHIENTVAVSDFGLAKLSSYPHHNDIANIFTDFTTTAPNSIMGGVRYIGAGSDTLGIVGPITWSGAHTFTDRPVLSTNNSGFATLDDISSLSGNHTTRSNLTNEDTDDVNTHATPHQFVATDIDIEDWGTNAVLLEVDISAGLVQMLTTTRDLRTLTAASAGTRVNPTNSLESIGGHLTEANGVYSIGGTGIAFGRTSANKLLIASQVSNAPVSVTVYRFTSAGGVTESEVNDRINAEIPAKRRVPALTDNATDFLDGTGAFDRIEITDIDGLNDRLPPEFTSNTARYLREDGSYATPPAGETSGLNQNQVDARIKAFARIGDTSTQIPVDLIPSTIARASRVTALERGTEYHTDASGPITVTVAEQDANVRHDFTILPTGSRVNFQYSNNPRLVEVWSQNQINLYSSTDIDGSDFISHAANTVIVYRVEQGGIFPHAERVGDRSILRGGYTLSALRNNIDFERMDQFIYRENTAQPLLVRVDVDFTTDSSTAAPSTTINGTSGNFTTIGLLWTASSTGGSFDETSDYQPTGNWDFQGELTQNSSNVVTEDTLPSVTFQKAFWDGGGDLRDSRYSTPAANVATANSGASPTNTFVADTGTYTSGVSIVNGVLRDVRTTTRKVIIPNWTAEANVDFSLAHLSCTFQHNVGSYQVAFYYGQDQSYRNGTGSDIMRDLTGIDTGILFGIWSGGSAGASKTMWCVNAKTGQYLQFPGNATNLSNKSNLSWSTNGTFTEIIPSNQSTSSGLTEAYNFGSPNKFEVYQIKSRLIVRLNGMTLIDGFLPETEAVAHDLSGRNFGLVMTRVTSGSSTNEVHQVIVEDISSNLVLNDNNSVSTFLELTDTPSAFTGENYYRANAGATALEARSPAHVLQDIGAQASVTNLTNRISPDITSNATQRKLVVAPNATVVSLADDDAGGAGPTSLYNANADLPSGTRGFSTGITIGADKADSLFLVLFQTGSLASTRNVVVPVWFTGAQFASLDERSTSDTSNIRQSTANNRSLAVFIPITSTSDVGFGVIRFPNNILAVATTAASADPMPLQIFEFSGGGGGSSSSTAPTPSANLVTNPGIGGNSFALPADFNTTHNLLSIVYMNTTTADHVRHVTLPLGYINTITTGTQTIRLQGSETMTYTATTRTFSNGSGPTFQFAQII